ncbi:MAG: hypothetical protein HKP61_13640, partial [Dactylosporangium sp.]|nr:hypothetical protein [Dactylosporangium sp.]NNJ61956.1 hypothetical protein [Dactylosporangium sp.]
PWIGALIEILLIELRHDTATHIVLGSAAALVPTLLLLGAIELVAWRRGPRQNAQFAPLHADHMDTSTGLAPAR